MKLQKYAEVFEQHGIYTIDDLVKIKEKHYDLCNVKKGHRRVLKKAIQKLMDENEKGQNVEHPNITKTIEDILQSIGLHQYVDGFHQLGCFLAQDVINITDEQLKQLDMKKGHVRVFRSYIDNSELNSKY